MSISFDQFSQPSSKFYLSENFTFCSLMPKITYCEVLKATLISSTLEICLLLLFNSLQYIRYLRNTLVMSFIFYMPPSLLFNTSVLQRGLPYSSVFRLCFPLNTTAFKNSLFLSADAYKQGLFYRFQHFFPFTDTDKTEMFLLVLFHFH